MPNIEEDRMELMETLLNGEKPNSLRSHLVAPLCQRDWVRVLEYHTHGGIKKVELTLMGQLVIQDRIKSRKS